MARVPLNDVTLQGTTPVRFAVGAQVYLYDRGTTNEVNVYPTEVGGAPLAQPLTVDAYGRTPGWVDEGSYDRVVDGETFYWEAVSAQGVGLSASAFAQTLLDDATATDARATLGAAAETDLQDHIDDTAAHDPSNEELAFAYRASDVAIAALGTALTGLQVTFTAPADPVMLHLFLPQFSAAAGGVLVCSILDDPGNASQGSALGILQSVGGSYHGAGVNVWARVDGLVEGNNYTYKGYAAALACTLECSATQRAFLRANVC